VCTRFDLSPVRSCSVHTLSIGKHNKSKMYSESLHTDQRIQPYRLVFSLAVYTNLYRKSIGGCFDKRQISQRLWQIGNWQNVCSETCAVWRRLAFTNEVTFYNKVLFTFQYTVDIPRWLNVESIQSRSRAIWLVAAVPVIHWNRVARAWRDY
jgi:hypothetical protein